MGDRPAGIPHPQHPQQQQEQLIGQARWWRRPQPQPDAHPAAARTRKLGRWQLAALGLLGAGIAAAAAYVATRPRVLPGDPVRPRVVEPFALADSRGVVHELAEWREASAVVLFVPGSQGPVASGYVPELRRLARRYRPRGVLFFCLDLDPASCLTLAGSADDAHGADLGLPFPTLVDPAQELAADLGLRATPAAAVLDAQGHLLYSGPIDNRYAKARADRQGPPHRALEDAIAAVLAGKAPLQGQGEMEIAAAGEPLPAPAPLLAPERTVTYHQDVAPILWRHCVECHRPGEVGPFSLLTYREAAKRADFVSELAASRRMPPWRAVHGYGDFEGASRLSRRELATLARWAEQGAPEGDPAYAAGTRPPTFPEGWQLGTPDRVLTMAEAFEVPGGKGDDFRTFVLPLGLERDVAVAAVEFRPGNRRIVHHARFYVDPTDDCRRLDAAAPGPGFPAYGAGGEPLFKPGLGAWVPGQVPRFPPEGVGKVVRKGSDLAALIHYHGTGKTETDQSSVGLYFCKKPPTRELLHVSLSSSKIDIPPGAKRHRMTLTYRMKADAHALSMIPHGHQLMNAISLTATLPGGKVVPMLWIDEWDFNWQGQYHFSRPLALPKGTRLDLVAYYDNSADNPLNPFHPPRRVRYGIRSDAEMLGCHVQIVADDDEAERVLLKRLPPGL